MLTSGHNWKYQDTTAHPAQWNFDHCAWCHGAAGIVMSRSSFQQNSQLSLGRRSAHMKYPNIFQPTFPDNAFTTIKSHVIKESSFDDSMCCGSLGCLDALLVANMESCKEIAPLLLTKFAKVGIHVDFENYGLFQGLGGVIYMLLRIINPMIVPSVCLWQIPT